MSPEPDQWIQYWYPLVGLAVAEQDVTIHDALLTRPSYQEWSRLERRDVADLRQLETMREALGQEVENTLPVCIVIVADPRDAPPDPELPPPHALWPAAQRLADAILYGLWLHKRGNILPPELFGRYVDASDGMLSRLPGYYRQEVPGGIRDGYELTAADLDAVEGLATLVARYHAGSTNPSADLALENLRASFGWHSSPVDQLVVLFAGLEAIFGAYTTRDQPFARVPMPARAALAAGGQEHMKAFLEQRGRRLRNAVAHGAPLDGDEPAADIETIRDILRRGLARYLAFCVDSDEDEQRPPMVRFNQMLAAAAG